MSGVRTVRVTWTVEYVTNDYQPETEQETDAVVERLMDAAPAEVSFIRDGEAYTWDAIGWKVDLPDYGDMSVGTLMAYHSDESEVGDGGR